MKAEVHKGNDFLSAEETLGSLLFRMGLISDKESDGVKSSFINRDIVIEVRKKRQKKCGNTSAATK